MELISKVQYAMLVEMKKAWDENRKPSIKELSFKLEVHIDTAYSAVQNLIKKGYIVRETRYRVLRFPDEVREIENVPRKVSGSEVTPYNKCSLEAVFYESKEVDRG